MSFTNITIKSAMTQIGENKMYLPAIQRKFVWRPDQIEKLFDSIMQDYPIGTFLFWKLNRDTANKHTFYQFRKDYHEKNTPYNDKAATPEMKEEIIGVLDGQQRLSGLYLALQGTYAFKKKYMPKTSKNAYPQRQLYVDLLYKAGEDDDIKYKFRFLTEEDRKKSDTEFWFPVKSVLSWSDVENNKIKFLLDNNLHTNVTASTVISKLCKKIISDEVISYFTVDKEEIDDILDIFVRVNSGGTILSKSNLLFSTIVANWEEGREKVELLQKEINEKGKGFRFTDDFIMQLCLILNDLPPTLKVKSFSKESVNSIKENWDKVCKTTHATVDLLCELGYSHETLTSQNAVIPMAYYLHKITNPLSANSKKNIKQYLMRAMINQTFSASVETALSSVINTMRNKDTKKLNNQEFELAPLMKIKFAGGTTLEFAEKDIDDLLIQKKGAETFMVLSLLYPHIEYKDKAWHQDHIHPAALLNRKKLIDGGLTEDVVNQIVELKDTLPNLQLLQYDINIKKSDTPFAEWFETEIPDERKAKFKEENYIDATLSLDIKDFLRFHEKRSKGLRAKLIKIFEV